MDYEKAKAKPFPDMEDLTRLIDLDTLLRAYWMQWRSGGMSFEQLLIAALVSMTEARRRTSEALLKAIAMTKPEPFTFPV